MRTFRLEIVTPDKAFYADTVQELVIKTPGGEIGILGGHIPLAVCVSIGPIRIKKDDQWLCAFVSEGFMEVTAEKTVVLADSAEWPEEIDAERARTSEAKARDCLKNHRGATERDQAQAALQRAIWRQKIAQKRSG